MPTPVSETAKCSIASPGSLRSLATRTTISPRSVNLTALLTRLAITWRRRRASPIRASGMVGGTWLISSTPFSLARTLKGRRALTTASRRLNSTGDSSSFRASIFEKSRMSLMTLRSVSADSRAITRYSRCSSASGVCRVRSVMPMMPFIGVRISWLMLARNSLLARLAASAACSAAVARCSEVRSASSASASDQRASNSRQRRRSRRAVVTTAMTLAAATVATLSRTSWLISAWPVNQVPRA